MQFVGIIILFLLCNQVIGKDNITKKPPNILIFLADDLGIGDIGCFGNATLKTPNIDSLCERGAKLTHHLAAESLCTPSRSALLTGRLPRRMGLSSPRGYLNVLINMAATGGLPPNETTFAKVLQQRGYNTGLVGKWHLGLNCKTYGDFCHHPNNHGFEYFFGAPEGNFPVLGPDGQAMLWRLLPRAWPMIVFTAVVGVVSLIFFGRIIGKWPAIIIGMLALGFSSSSYLFRTHADLWISALYRNTELVEQPMLFDNLTERLITEGVHFLEDAQKQGKPFLLIMSWLQVHSWLHAHMTSAFQNANKNKNGIYGDEVEEMDWSVGEVVKAVERLGFSEDTLIYFTSDNGGHLEEHDIHGRRAGGYNGIYRGSKGQGGQDGGIRIPGTLTWPGHIPGGHVIHEPTSQMDMFPTLLGLAGAQVPQNVIYDGRDIGPLLTGEKPNIGERFFFHYCNHILHAVRFRPENSDAVYKMYYYYPNWTPNKGDTCYPKPICFCEQDYEQLETPLLFNMETDPSEHDPLNIAEPPFQDVVKRIHAAKVDHEANLQPVQTQFDASHVMWWPQLQPCCNFPYCECTDPHNSLQRSKLIKP